MGLIMYRTQRWEAHIWQEGKQIYLGGFDAEEQAALAYDLAALKFRGPDAHINFDISNYEQELLHFNDVSTSSLSQAFLFCKPASYEVTHRLCTACLAQFLFNRDLARICGRSQQRRSSRTCGDRARGTRRRAASTVASRATRRANGRLALAKWLARSTSASRPLCTNHHNLDLHSLALLSPAPWYRV